MTISVICALEGAFVMARTLRSVEPLVVAGETVAHRYRGTRLDVPDRVAAAKVKSR